MSFGNILSESIRGIDFRARLRYTIEEEESSWCQGLCHGAAGIVAGASPLRAVQPPRRPVAHSLTETAHDLLRQKVRDLRGSECAREE